MDGKGASRRLVDHDPRPPRLRCRLMPHPVSRWIGRKFLRIFRECRHLSYRFMVIERSLTTHIFAMILKLLYGRRVSFRSVEILPSETGARWSEQSTQPVRLSIVIVSYRQPVALQCLLTSLACQTVQNFEILVAHDGPDPETRDVVARFSESFPRCSYYESSERYNDWGHSLRDIGVKFATGEFILITNGDNYYVPRFTEFLFDAINIYNFDLIFWNIVHSYTSLQQKTLRCYTPLRVFPARYLVDIAAVVARTTMAKQVGFSDRGYNGDATYVEQLISSGGGGAMKIGKIEKALTVHN